MSVVTGVVLVTSISDAQPDEFEGRHGTHCVADVNAWLAARDLGPLVQVDDHGGGTKHPECRVFVAGYNYFGCTPRNALDFTRADFAAFVVGLPWSAGESLVLVLNPPDLFPVEVYRVPEARWSHIW